jgi:hypothetical protein
MGLGGSYAKRRGFQRRNRHLSSTQPSERCGACQEGICSAYLDTMEPLSNESPSETRAPTNGAGAALRKPLLPICPECGTPSAPSREARPPGWTHWRRVVPVLVALAAVGILGVMTAYAARSSSSGGYARGSPFYRFPTEPISYPAIRGLASGETSDDRFVSRVFEPVLSEPPRTMDEHTTVWVSFRAPSGTRWEQTTRGWPWTVYSTARRMISSNVYEDTGTPATTPAAYSASAWYFTGGNLAGFGGGSLDWWSIDLGHVAIGMCAVLVAAAAGALLCGRKLPRLARSEARRRCRVRLLLGGCFMLAVVFSGGLLKTYSEPHLSPDYSQPSQASAIMTLADLRAAAAEPGGSQRVAKFIIDDLPRPAGRDTFLAWGTRLEAQPRHDSTDVGWPTRWLYVAREYRGLYSEDGSAATPIDIPAHPARVVWHGTTMSVSLASDRARPSGTHVTIEFGVIAIYLIALWLLWALTRLACTLGKARLVKRRLRLGQCAECGYDLKTA